LTVELASAVPATVGVVLFVLNGEVAGVVIAGAVGATVSTVKVFVALEPVLPARSVWVTWRVCEPWPSTLSAEPLVHETGAPLSTMQLDVAAGFVSVTVKVTVGVAVLTFAPFAGAVSETVGAVVSITIVLELEAGLTFVAASVEVAVIVCEPTESAEVLSVHAPPALATVVPTSVAPS
jgi:hypothetical protein